MTPSYQREFELLLQCTRTVMDEPHRQKIRELVVQDLDWDYFAQKAWKQGVMPLIHYQLNAAAADIVPQDVASYFKEHYQTTMRRNLSMGAELVKAIRLLRDNGVDALAYKGASLAVMAYRNLTLRMFSDIDILVPESQARRAKDILCEKGYIPSAKMAPTIEDAHLRFQTAYNFTTPDGVFSLDLQWRVLPRYFAFPISMDELFKRQQPITLLNSILPSLAVEDLVLVLCVHGMKHVWERLSWICDIAELVRYNPDFNWQECVQRAQKLGSLRMLLIGLEIAHRLLDAQLPADITQRIQQDKMVGQLCETMIEQLKQEHHGVFDDARFSSLHMQARENLRDKLQYLLQVTLTPINTDMMRWNLPKSLFFLYYPLRLARLGWVYSRKTLQQIIPRSS